MWLEHSVRKKMVNYIVVQEMNEGVGAKPFWSVQKEMDFPLTTPVFSVKLGGPFPNCIPSVHVILMYAFISEFSYLK